ncbi:unnamed protein product [Nippostrongylus brasiliensis]|uniref:Omp85 domain-containing protein n=1 Tax=Nippostrongylus brasiliensis TaxID=27835 RepID=A0A0N4YET8_NIPBR|nr:unnamed protein product [Nippostrongylus brasiliensis]
MFHTLAATTRNFLGTIRGSRATTFFADFLLTGNASFLFCYRKPCDALQYAVDPRRMGTILTVMEKRFHDAATINARSGIGFGIESFSGKMTKLPFCELGVRNRNRNNLQESRQHCLPASYPNPHRFFFNIGFKY